MALLPKVTNFPNGINDRSLGTEGVLPDPMALSKMAFLDPTRNIRFFADFIGESAGMPVASSGLAAASAATPWVFTVTEAGAGNAASAFDDVNGGAFILTNDAADDDVISVQSRGECYKWSASKRLFFEARFKVSDATQSDVYMGLIIRDTSLVASAPTDGLYFVKVDGSTTLNFLIVKNSTATTVATATMANDTYITVSFYYDPDTSSFYIFLNDTLVGRGVSTNAVDDEELAITFAIQNGEAVAKIMTIDWIFAALER